MIIVRLEDYYAFAEYQTTKPSSIIKDDTLRIAFIGDSWAELQLDDSLQVAAERLFTNRNVRCRASGVGGAKSKAIYYNLLDDNYNLNPKMYFHPYKDVLIQCPDYCIVSTGINDAATKMGADFYVHHTILIINHLISHGITPVLLEIPLFDEIGQFEKLSLSKRMFRRLSMLVSNSNMQCVDEYRRALKKSLSSEVKNDFIFIEASQWSNDGFKDNRNLWKKDNLHLNNNGYYVLDSCIMQQIFEYENRFQQHASRQQQTFL